VSGPDGSFVGCHGVAVDPPHWGRRLGRAVGAPLARLQVGTLDESLDLADAERLWRIDEVSQELWLDGDGRSWLTVEGVIGLRMDLRLGEVRLRPMREAAALQLLTTFVVPRLAQAAGAVVVHAASFARAGRAIAVCAESGGGKSSLIVAMAEGGWTVLSEDLTAIDIDSGGAWVWPGPPWVRLGPEAIVPAGWQHRFVAPDKTGWSLDGRMADRPIALGSLVFLESPGGDKPVWGTVLPAATVAALARHLPWTGDPADRAARLFPDAVRLAGSAPARTLRLPISSEWASLAAEEFDRQD
jgi:hypothetical protein